MENVREKVVMITGAAGGLGYGFAEILLRNGARHVALIDLVTSAGQRAASTLQREFGAGRVTFLACDVTKAAELDKTFREVVGTFERLDILINNAGVCSDHRLEQTVDVNVTALIRGSLLALDHMGKHKGGKGGTIVNVASTFGLWKSCFPIYAATKHAVIGFSRSIADFYGATGVRVVMMCPGITSTPLTEAIHTAALDVARHTDAFDQLAKLPKQSIDNVARATLDLIRAGENGAAWVSEGGQPPYAVDFVHYSQRPLPV